MAQLGEAKMVAESIRTTATVTLDKVEGGFSITAVHLDLTAKIPNPENVVDPAEIAAVSADLAASRSALEAAAPAPQA